MKGKNGIVCPIKQDDVIYQQAIENIKKIGIQNFLKRNNKYYEFLHMNNFSAEMERTYSSITHCYSLYSGLKFIIESNGTSNTDNIQEDAFNEFFESKGDAYGLKQLIAYTSDNMKIKDEQKKPEWQMEFDLVKGAIYKIKRYFMENNTIRDIRGGSIIIDYLNIEYVKQYLENKKNGLIPQCLIYSGGGSILLMVPKGQGARVCKELEQGFFNIGLTAMNAFESITISINDFMNSFNKVLSQVNRKLEERQKSKMYNFDPDSTRLETLNISSKVVTFEEPSGRKAKLCDLCAIRQGQYEINDEVPKKIACPTCYRKHIVGKKAKNNYFDQYKEYVKAAENIDTGTMGVDTIDDLKDENGNIAVIYGDGNNMGNIVKNMHTPLEMMFFSEKLDYVTKTSVYNALHNVMGKKVKFEVLAIGGDDLFLIVPAKYALNISKEIVKRFDEMMGHQLTMSVGVCIGKYYTPVRSMFEKAQENLKIAKQKLKQLPEEKQQEGNIHITELIGGQIVDEHEKGLFPLYVSQLEVAINQVKRMEEAKLRFYDYEQASKIMEKDEFNLYFEYKEAQVSKNENTNRQTKEYLTDILNQSNIPNQDSVNVYLQKHKPWRDLILIVKYGGKS